MRLIRLLPAAWLASVVAFGAVAISSGCGDNSNPAGGTVVKEDPAEARKREQMIADMYKKSPPSSNAPKK